MIAPSPAPLVDPHGRQIRYLRLSITPHCNFRCAYCQPDGPVLPDNPRDVLSPEECERIVRIFVRLGARKVRLTGGEPTLRKDLLDIVQRLADIPGLDDLSLSTHGMFLEALADPLARSGLRRINLSLDTLDRQRFHAVAGRDALDRVLAGLAAARKAGLTPIKLNVVPMRGFNDDEIGALLDLAGQNELKLRFIELMPLGVARDLHAERRLTGDELLALLSEHGTWRSLERRPDDGPARVMRRHEDGLEVGIIDPSGSRFCENCNRVRVTHRGELRNCLFGKDDLPLRPLLARPDWESAVEAELRHAILDKPERHRLEQLDDGRLHSLVRVGG